MTEPSPPSDDFQSVNLLNFLKKSTEDTPTTILPTTENVNMQLHPLQNRWCFWFMKRQKRMNSVDNYESNIKKIGGFDTVEDMWAYYNFLVRPNDSPATCDYHLFKDGIKPMWEDDNNKNGGKWIVRLRKGLASKCWESLFLAVSGEEFVPYSNEICGIVISIRLNEDLLSLWTRTSDNDNAKKHICEVIKRVLNLSANQFPEYKVHAAALHNSEKRRWYREGRVHDKRAPGTGGESGGDGGGSGGRGRSGGPEWLKDSSDVSANVNSDYQKNRELFEKELQAERDKNNETSPSADS